MKKYQSVIIVLKIYAVRLKCLMCRKTRSSESSLIFYGRFFKCSLLFDEHNK